MRKERKREGDCGRDYEREGEMGREKTRRRKEMGGGERNRGMKGDFLNRTNFVFK